MFRACGGPVTLLLLALALAAWSLGMLLIGAALAAAGKDDDDGPCGVA